MEIRSIIELTLAIDCLLLSIEQYRLSKRVRKLSGTVFYLSSKDEKEVIQYDKRRNINWENMLLKKKNKQLKDKLSKIETLIINHNCDTGDIYYKYNSKFLKSELKQRILEILYEQGSDSNE